MTTPLHEHHTSDPTALLRRAGLRATEQRVAVITEVRAHKHADADLVIQATRQRLGHVSTQAVYDVLAALSAAGIVRRIEPAGSRALYEIETHDNHHHAVCRMCGHVEDVACAAGRRPCLDAVSTAGYVVGADGFVIDEAEVVYWGLCATCRADD